MSNRDFDDDFNFDDDFDTGSGNDLSDDLSPDFGDEGDSGDLPDLGDEPDERGGDGGGGPSRTFIIIAGIMIALFVIGLIALVLIATSNGTGHPTELEFQATTIVAANMTTEANLTETTIAIQNFDATNTAIALIPPTPTPRPTITPTFTPTEAPTLDPTQLAAVAFTQTADASALQTQTAIAALSQIPPTSTGISLEAVQQTATALVIAFGATPTPGVDLGIGGGGTEVVPTREVGSTTGNLPETGFFDDIGTGRDGVGMVVLMGFGLVGVIFVSRRLRAVNSK